MDPLTEKNKRDLREAMRRRLADLRLEDADEASRRIRERLESLPEVNRASCVLLYAALPQEVHTFELMQSLLDRGGAVGLPTVAAREIVPRRVRDLAELRPGSYGILEPPSSSPVITPDSMDAVIVPGLAFDLSLRRLGRGGGFYDRFLARTKAKRIAVAYDLQIVESVPAEDHDLRMDCVVTEKRIIA